ncbi:CRISPR-associated ring nuclease Csm6 [Vineibacter terrae]|nr:CRISPR-associated ring nuclease Csm6 [Vineibacter terrae]
MTSEPAAYPRRLLLAVVGLTPQIVTETLFALVKRTDPPFIPTHIRLITTMDGAERIRLQLLDSRSGAFGSFARQHCRQVLKVTKATRIDVLDGASGTPLVDITSAEDSMVAADRIVEIVRAETARRDSAICASIAGGRKTMGFLLGYALSLYGRPQDRLTHVLVASPFENHPEFFFPPARPRVLIAPRDNRPICTDDARVVLTDIPFLRLRAGLPRLLLDGGRGFAETVAEAQAALGPHAVRIVPARLELVCAGRVLRLPPVDFAFYLWLARRRQRAPAQGAIVYPQNVPVAEFLDNFDSLPAAARRQSGRVRRALADGIDKDWLEERVSRVNKLVVDALGYAAAPYRIVRSGRRPASRYGLSDTLTDIVIESALSK